MQGAGFSVDSDNHKAYFYGQKDGESSWRLYTVDLITGTTSYVSIDDVGQGGFDFDTYQPDKLIGYRWHGEPVSGTEEIISIDPSTGITSSLATIDIDWVMQGAGFSVDSDNHKAYFYGQKDGESSWRLYTVDLITGTTSYVSIDDVGQGGFDFDTYQPVINVSQCATFNLFATPPAPQLFLPCVQVGAVYQVGMNLIAVDPSLRFEVDPTTLLPPNPPDLIPTGQCAVFPDPAAPALNHLRINCLQIGDQTYWVDLVLTSVIPTIQFDVVGFGQ
ncbi:hypothetical protein [Thioflexithrix psekupsensis]|uniref:DUF4394 domain-containing protein n=1 Tax=Thioflexithrix psekupsensis TaxID=1570016 RepID=A0A251X8W5_9GAMM|nr:hypothetical protein [Thioflexithrix psekupsensis]OUD14508.1 hypothetical protein TPSD3_09430 [Thioflexithrix psekupsensis]